MFQSLTSLDCDLIMRWYEDILNPNLPVRIEVNEDKFIVMKDVMNIIGIKLDAGRVWHFIDVWQLERKRDT